MLFVIARTLSFQKWATYQADLPTFFIHIINSAETGGCSVSLEAFVVTAGCFWHQ